MARASATAALSLALSRNERQKMLSPLVKARSLETAADMQGKPEEEPNASIFCLPPPFGDEAGECQF